MKAFSFILSVYLASLFVVPCCAFDDCPDDKMTAAQKADHQPGDEDDCGTCSPFFNCDRCVSVTINTETINTLTPVTGIKVQYAGIVHSLVCDAHYDFWQPPRAG